jgi:hypothetical protein
MFLPVLLVRDLGVGGWIVFAVPNVVGAAAMGWVLSRQGASERIVRDHAAACSIFSVTTIAFHVFFVLWFVPRLVGLPAAAMVFALTAVYLVMTVTRAAFDMTAAAIVWIFSVAMMVLFLRHAGPIHLPMTGSNPAIDVAWLTPVCIFGFAFCPYLDLTFHRARQALDPAGTKVAFGVGFGICFLLMIVFTLLYASTLAPRLNADWRDQARSLAGTIVGAHMVVQAAFTIAAHTRSFVTVLTRPRPILLLAIMSQIALFLGLAANLLSRYHGMDAGEVIYRSFMAFYGLVFPSYVFVCMLPSRDGVTSLTPAKLRALVLGVLVAAPMYWMGFIENRMIWLLPGLAVVMLSRYTVPRQAGRLAATGE